MAVAAGSRHTVGLKADGTVVAVGENEDGECEVGGWKLFDNFETIEAERKAAAERAETERKETISARQKEQAALQTELAGLKGLFAGKRRREIEGRLAQIEAELQKLG